MSEAFPQTLMPDSKTPCRHDTGELVQSGSRLVIRCNACQMPLRGWDIGPDKKLPVSQVKLSDRSPKR